jgi:hypothetical protein
VLNLKKCARIAKKIAKISARGWHGHWKATKHFGAGVHLGGVVGAAVPRRYARFAMVGYGRLWSAMVGYGRLWSAF